MLRLDRSTGLTALDCELINHGTEYRTINMVGPSLPYYDRWGKFGWVVSEIFIDHNLVEVQSKQPVTYANATHSTFAEGHW